MPAGLKEYPEVKQSFGYVLIRDGKRIDLQEGAAVDFVYRDPNRKRHDTLCGRSASRFAVYYKQENEWIAIPKNFQRLIECIPYLQSGIRVLVEYEFTHYREKSSDISSQITQRPNEGTTLTLL